VRITYAEGKQTAAATTRVAICVLAGVLAFIITAGTGHWSVAPLIAWDIAALVYLIWMWSTIWPLNHMLTQKFALREDPSRPLADAILVIASTASLLAVALVLAKAAGSTGWLRLAEIALGVVSVVVSWSVVHTIFALRYAELFYQAPVGGIDFKDGQQPAYTDFAYLAFTVGMTFQVSDTELRAHKFRTTVLKHALISYLFGTVIVATTINLIAGLSK
jgi:uncharacterized membrane protein